MPKGQRGPAFAYNQFIMFTVVPVVAFLAWQLVPLTIFGLEGWRCVVILGSVGAVFIWWIRLGLPELPRWLAQHGHAGRGRPASRAQMERAISAGTGRPLPAPEVVAGEEDTKPGAWSEMWSPTYRGRTIMLMIYNLFQTIGYYGFQSWVPKLSHRARDRNHPLARIHLHHRHRQSDRAAHRPSASPIAFERKWQIAWAAIGIAIFGLLFSQQTSATRCLSPSAC